VLQPVNLHRGPAQGPKVGQAQRGLKALLSDFLSTVRSCEGPRATSWDAGQRLRILILSAAATHTITAPTCEVDDGRSRSLTYQNATSICSIEPRLCTHRI
jgi:hypothetical protein